LKNRYSCNSPIMLELKRLPEKPKGKRWQALPFALSS
jgi:hypothetical protein